MTTAAPYDPSTTENRMSALWEEKSAFTADVSSSKEPYVISMPPPNATGELHIGHALFLTIQDVLIRTARLQGKEALWVPGTDHAAIATESVVIRNLQKEGIKDPRRELGRDKLVAAIAEYVEQSRGTIRAQIRQMGASADWSRERYTLEPALNRCVNEVFKLMYDDGLIYRGHRIVNWDPKLQTTVSDDEIEWQTEKTPLYTLQYGPFAITTARPETKFGDKYVVMHPDDARYSEYPHGQKIELEWINGPVTATVIKDTAVDPTFGTGVMTITPWHDAIDFDIAQRHELDREQIIDFEGRLLPSAGEFAGLRIDEARPKIIERLREKGLLVHMDENYTHNVATNSRGKGKIEPQIKLQWFVDVNKPAVTWQGKKMSLKAVMQNAVRGGDITIKPARFEKLYFHWIDNLRDWCISRQIWWGHRIPVWYKGDETYVGHTLPEGEGWSQDPDTLDTWFSSALWTWSTLVDKDKALDPAIAFRDVLEQSPDFKRFHPTTVMETGYDIIFFWVARMILMTTYATGQIPFHTVFLHGLVTAKTGKKMSKSDPSSIIDPRDMIEKYGADALRFGLMYQMSYGAQAIKFDETAVKAARNFANKLWNLGRLLSSLPEREEETPADHWITWRLNHTAALVTQSVQEYHFGEAAQTLHRFVWQDFADWYVEILKTTGSTTVARNVYRTMLVLLHPFMPHITEALWQMYYQEGLLATQSWVAGDAEGIVGIDVEQLERFKDVVSTVRSARTLLGIRPASTVDVALTPPPVLPQALEALAHSRLSENTATGTHAKQFPLRTGGVVTITSEEITAESVARARERLTKTQDELVTAINKHEHILATMRGKAEPQAVEEKEAALAALQIQHAETAQSLQLLQ